MAKVNERILKAAIEEKKKGTQLWSTNPWYKGGKNIQQKKDSLFNQWCWENWTATCKRMVLEHFITPYNNKLIMDYRSKCKSLKDKTQRREDVWDTLWHEL